SRYHRGHLDECDDLEFATARQGGRRDPRTRQTAGVALSRSEALIDRRNVHLLGDRSPVIVRIVDAWRQRDLLMMDGLVGVGSTGARCSSNAPSSCRRRRRSTTAPRGCECAPTSSLWLWCIAPSAPSTRRPWD